MLPYVCQKEKTHSKPLIEKEIIRGGLSQWSRQFHC